MHAVSFLMQYTRTTTLLTKDAPSARKADKSAATPMLLVLAIVSPQWVSHPAEVSGEYISNFPRELSTGNH